jgi:hypothetical protein
LVALSASTAAALVVLAQATDLGPLLEWLQSLPGNGSKL